MNKKAKLTITIYLVPLIFSTFGYSQNKKDQTQATTKALNNAAWSISAIECLEHVEKLASPEFAGRGTGEDKFNLTAKYIAKHFQEIGLIPAVGDSSFFQLFSVTPNFIGENNQLSMEVLIKTKKGLDTLWVNYILEKDFLPSGFSQPIDAVTDIVFAGYGITSPDNKWNDYKKLNVEGKTVVVLGGAPAIKDIKWGNSHRIRSKAKNAKDHGAAAFFSIGSPIGIAANQQIIPGAIITKKVANDLLKGTGLTVKNLKDNINKNEKSFSLKLKNRVKLKIDAKLREATHTKNIAGYLPGNDPVLKNEFIVLGAHADHLGRLGDLIFYGANDNASGTAIIMEVAQAITQLGVKPKRSILFVAFSGEEMGLLGSKFYVDNPLFPIKNTRAKINLDMVGSGRDGVMIVGGNTFPKFAEMFEKFNHLVGYADIHRRWTSNNSDHFPFHKKGIPAVFLYAMGGLPTYHSTRDKAETVDGEVMESIGRLVFRVMWDLSNTKNIEFPIIQN
ncbi:M28 family peptidase [candidate division KSB1 bacterium]|nr:M28 family peptidase [candidate division KSB1 bacterium]MBL7092373.1 M28 family peptidase [candidate division KSB1 bacterium]